MTVLSKIIDNANVVWLKYKITRELLLVSLKYNLTLLYSETNYKMTFKLYCTNRNMTPGLNRQRLRCESRRTWER